MLFFTSPAYSVPSTSTSPRSKSTPMKVSERTPIAAPPAASEPAWITVNAGLWLVSCSGVGRTNSVRANRHCQARSVTTRMGSPCCGEAPAKPSKVKMSFRSRCPSAFSSRRSNTADSTGDWAAPHQTSFSVAALETTYLSLGDRPVLTPVRTVIAPLSASCPSPRRTAASIRAAERRFR